MMTDKDSRGTLGLDWIADCGINEAADNTLTDWIRTALNCPNAELDRADGAVWSGTHWLTQAECDRLRATIDRGV